MNNKLILSSLFTLLMACGDGLPSTPDAGPDADLTPDVTTLSLNGEACESSLDCDKGLCKQVLGEGRPDELVLPDGLCTSTCAFETNEGCDPVEELCLVFLATGELSCFQRCLPSLGDCDREGWGCFDVGNFNFMCIPN